MTNSNEPPLTRRQARELERARENAATAASQPVQQAAPDAAPPADLGSPPIARPAMPNYSPGLATSSLTAPVAVVAPPAPSAAAETPVAVTPPPMFIDDGVPQRTLTRRELRAMLAAQEGAAQEHAPEAVEPEPEPEAAAPVVMPVTSAPADARIVEDRETRRVSWTPAPVPPVEQEVRPVWAATPPVDDAASAPVVSPAWQAPAPAPVPVSAEFDEADRSHATDVAPVRPIGHWSVEAASDDLADIDGDAQPSFDQILSRGSSGGVPTTTSALILPTIPDSGTGTVSLNTGEVLVTGSFDLPRSLGATGAHPDRIDSSDLDALFDDDEQVPQTGAQPIRASRAVSTHTSTRDVLTPPKKERRLTMPLILAIAGGVLVVSVAALIVAGFVAGIF